MRIYQFTKNDFTADFRLDFLPTKSVHAKQTSLLRTSASISSARLCPGLRWWKHPMWVREHRRSTVNIAGRRTQLPAREAAANPTRRNELSQRIATLNELTAQQLRDEWRRLYRGQPPRLSRDLLIRTTEDGHWKSRRALPGVSRGRGGPERPCGGVLHPHRRNLPFRRLRC